MLKTCKGESESGRRCISIQYIHKNCGGRGCYKKDCSNALLKNNGRCRYCDEVIYDVRDLKYDE